MNEPTFPVYYWDSDDGVGIDSAKPQQMSLQEALVTLWKLSSHKSFMGICLPDQWLMQLYVEEDLLFHVEHMKQGTKTARTCMLNLPLAELVLRAIYDGKQIEDSLIGFPVKWCTEQLWD